MLLPCLPLAPLLSQVKNKYDKDEVLIFAELTFFGGQSRGSAEWKKKMCLVLETLINLLLLNSNNLTYWSRECPVCFPWGSVSFSAGADDVMRDGGGGGRWKETFDVIRPSHWGDTSEGTQKLQEEPPLQVTPDAQLCEDTGSGSPGCDWSQVLTAPANLFWGPSTSRIYPAQAPPSLVTDIYDRLLLYVRHYIQSCQ